MVSVRREGATVSQRKFSGAGLLVLLLAYLLFPESSPAATLVFPPPKTAVGEKFITIAMRTAPNTTVAWQHIKSTGIFQGQSVSNAAGIFSMNIEMEPGINRINADEMLVEVFYDDGGKQLPPGFIKRTMHAGDTSSCSDCHDTNSGELLENGYPGVCLACHVVVSQNPENQKGPSEDSHFRTVVAHCGNCHEPHFSANNKLLNQKVAKRPCASCHQDKYVGETTHKAFEEGGCSACHESHFSGYPNHLRHYMPGTCNECHSQGVNINPKVAHPPTERGGETCERCHNPHSANPKLLKQSVKATCTACHPKILSHGHKEELSDCGKCHDPHGAIGTGLLRKDFPAGCESCHDDIRKGKIVHKPVSEGCSKCHAPHSDDNRTKAISLCLKCHDMQPGSETSKLHGGLPIAVGKCGLCHEPHSSAEPQLLKKKTHYPLTQGKCDSCHGSGESKSLKVPSSETFNRCGKCHATIRELQARATKLHDPVQSGDCTECHNPHMSNNNPYLNAPIHEVCAKCHDQAKTPEGKKPHPAAANCADCHAPHGNDQVKFLKEKEPKLCINCHDDPTLKKKYVHTALAKGCTACHDPHSGYGKAFLKKKDAELCLGCHKDPAEGKKVPHPALDEGCTTCHNPHASDTKKLLKAPGNRLCIDCHKDPAAGGKAHAAFEEGCTVCHKPHGSDEKKLLADKVSKICLNCHDDPAKGKSVVHPALDEGCTACHNPHVSKTGKLLVKPISEVCAGCHDKLGPKHHILDGKAASSYPKEKGPFPVANGQLVCTGCHNPHASNEKMLYVRPEGDICSSCH